MHVILLLIAGVVLWKFLHPVFRNDKANVVCRNCGTCDRSKTISPRNLFIEILLWFAGLIPGVLYTLWCNHETHSVCSKCRSRDIVPLDSPVGRKLAGSVSVDAVPMSQQAGRK